MSKSLLIALSFAALALASCSQSQTGESPTIETSHAFRLMPTPSDQTLWASQLSRYAGQTEFLTLNPWNNGGMAEAVPVSAEAGNEREEQEADVFKIGKPGSKEVYLLNNYRGLQIVSFAKGAANPEILGRVNPTGNYPQRMYSDLNNNRLIVIENTYNNSKMTSRLVVYDVSNSSAPLISSIIDIAGYSVDSRIVGSVLYLATYESQTSGSIWFNDEASNGKVLSFDIQGKDISAIAEFKMKLPIASPEMMNIQVTGTGADTTYYLVAIQTEMNRDWWSWWSGPAAVEVIDITDPKGEIKPLMTANVKGFISERSSTLIRNGYLIVTSNYIINAEAEEQVLRIAVEAFQLPKANSEVISSQEAQYRQLHIDRQVSVAKDSDKQKLQEQLLADSVLGLKGRFVQEDNGSLKKIVADSDVTVGDTNGQSASLQDVRYDGNYLYAFWVPADQVDPLDVFDIGNLDQGVKHLGRLEFDGWIEKSFPITFQNRKFIVGLGWVVPAVDTEDTQRKMQAKLFEVKTEKISERDPITGNIITKDKVLATVVPGAELVITMDGGSMYADLNSPDRYIQLLMDPASPGKGQILFEAASYEAGSYRQGGQIIQIDMNEAVLGLGSTAVTKGPFLEANEGWLRRMFANPELANMYNAFSDSSLSTFETINSGQGLAKTLSVLELARNITAYYVLKGAQSEVGVQVISNYNYNDTSTVELRTVKINQADAEVNKVTGVVKIEGRLQSSIMYKDSKSVLLLTSQNVSSQQDAEASTSTIKYALTKVTLNANQEMQTSVQTWTEKQSYLWNSSATATTSLEGNESLTLLSDGTVLVKTEQAQILKANQTLSLVAINDSTCPKASDVKAVTVKEIDGQLMYFAQQTVDVESVKGAATKNTISLATLKADTLVCSAEINIPGTPVMINGSQVVTDDLFASDTKIVEEEYTNEDGTKIYALKSKNVNALTLVELQTTNKASLFDSTTDISTNYGMEQTSRIRGDQNFYVIRNANTDSWMYSSQEPELVTVSIENKRFVTTSAYLDGAKGYTQIIGLVLGSQKIAVIESEAGVQVFALSKDQRPEVINIRMTKEDGSTSGAQSALEIGGLSYSPMIHYTEAQNSIELASGLRGVVQLYLSK